MKARIYSLALMCVALAFCTTGSAFADVLLTGPTLYITNPIGNQILTVDGTTGATTVLYTGSLGFTPHAIVYGPDGKLYVSQPGTNEIDRLNADGSGFVPVYQFSGGGQPTAPEGLHFNGGFDLYFTAQDGGVTSVWKIAGVATIATAGPFPAPTLVVTLPGSTAGTGVAFGRTGNLLFVDQSGNRIMQAAPPYTTATPLITGLSSAFGIAVNSTGDIFVANNGTKQILHFSETGASDGAYVTFSGSDSPLYIGFDVSDNLYVVTATESVEGYGMVDDASVWKVAPAAASTTQLIYLDSLCQPESGEGSRSCGSESGLNADSGMGVAVPPTSTSLSFAYNPTNTTNIFFFGSDSIKFNFLGTINPNGFTMWVTKTQVLPAILGPQLSNTVFPAGTSCVQFSHEGGFCDTYTVADGAVGSPAPVLGTDFTGLIQVVMGFFTQNPTQNPSLGHSPGTVNPPYFTEDIIFNYLPQLIPGTDNGLSGNANGFSNFAPLNVPLVLTNGKTGNFCGVFPPLPPYTFKFLPILPIPVTFELTTGANCSGQEIRNAVARISLMKSVGSSFIVQNVSSFNSFNNLNFFRVEGDRYVYLLDTKGLSAGSYVLCIWGDKFSPLSVPFQVW